MSGMDVPCCDVRNTRIAALWHPVAATLEAPEHLVAGSARRAAVCQISDEPEATGRPQLDATESCRLYSLLYLCDTHLSALTDRASDE